MSEQERTITAVTAKPGRRAAPLVTGMAKALDRAKREAQSTWEFIALVEFANFTMLRRYVGIARAEALTEQLAPLIGSAIAGGEAWAAGRNLVEVKFRGQKRTVLDEILGLIEEMFSRPVDIDGEAFALEVTVAGAAIPAFEFDRVRLIEEAERALVIARAEHAAIAREVSLAASSDDRAELASDLRRAIASDELFIQYQPKIHLRRQEVSGVEALIRWRHPTRGLVMPSDFIPVAEETHAIATLTLWTLRQVIDDQRKLIAAGYDLPVFVNIAGVLLANARFVRQACALVEKSGARLGFEITETSVIRDPDSAIAHLKTFADIGITIAIDDYGAGLSSLAYLKQLPARELKIDKLFVTQLTSSNRDPLIVRSTIDLAHALEMEVVAEGVESQAALALLAVMGCDMAQGFLISRPVGLDALLRFLAEDQHLSSYWKPPVPSDYLNPAARRR